MTRSHGGLLATNSRPAASDDGERPDDDFTVRAVVTGLLVGCLVAFTNLSLGLQSGWTSMMSLQSALLGYGLLKAVRIPSFQRRPFSMQENAVLQVSPMPRRAFVTSKGVSNILPSLTRLGGKATAVAVGSMPLSLGFVGIIPALNQLDPEQDGSGPIKLGYSQLIAWSFGVFFASPLRPALILKEKLPFPSGTATAQLISVLHHKPLVNPDPAPSAGPTKKTPVAAADNNNAADELDSKAGWRALMWSFGGSSAYTILSFFIPVLYAMPIFDPICPGHNAASLWGWWFTPSFSYIGQGIIMGLPTAASMTLGAFVGWAILSPIAYFSGWAPGDPLSEKDGSRAWLMWIALAIMCSESILGLVALLLTNGSENIKKLLKVPSWLQSKQMRRQQQQQPGILDTGADRDGVDAGDVEHEPPSRLTSTRTVVSGLVASTVLAVILIQLTFKRSSAPVDAKHPATTNPAQTVLAVIIALVLSLLGARALGATDLNPVSGLGKISQLVFAVTSPGNVVANLIAGGISEAGAMAAGDMLQDLKTGHLVGSAPHSQFKGQLVGSTLGIFVSVFAYQLYAKTYQLPGPQFPVPSAGVWLNLARLLNNGHLPAQSGKFMAVFAALFAVTGVARSVARARHMKRQHQAGRSSGGPRPRWEIVAEWMPSGIAFAVGILNTPNFSLSRLAGGLIGHFYLKHIRRLQQQRRGQTATNGRDAAEGEDEDERDDDGPGGSTANTPDERTGLLRRRGYADGGDEDEDDVPESRPHSARASSSRAARAPPSSKALEGVYIIVIASGFVLGEGAASIVTLLLKQAGFQPLTCFGCRGGCNSC
ncbi:OPT superfamily protein [Tilletia horrida]|uniref:OPT superfamily protein n=1 Tax=Tilletia horrida TaxID=155126 RepID=A0AAN6GC02_9BASI|nr:OPT superfamily protein [Tilletia horrida]